LLSDIVFKYALQSAPGGRPIEAFFLELTSSACDLATLFVRIEQLAYSLGKTDTVLGPVQNHLQYQRLQSSWDEIKKSGASILFRGDVPASEKGFFFPVNVWRYRRRAMRTIGNRWWHLQNRSLAISNDKTNCLFGSMCRELVGTFSVSN
jgi:hypothetical protein